MTSTNNRAIMPIAIQIILGLWIAGVIAAAFLYLPPAKGFAAPEAARIIVFHVPCAMVAVLAYVISMVYAIIYLIKGGIGCDTKSAASAGLGFLFTLLATVTGMVFAKVQWGSAWNGDPRETSILMLMIVYAAYFALRSAIPASASRAKISAVYNILAGLVMPYLVFVLPRLTTSLHPSSTLTKRSSLSPEYGMVLGCAMLGFMLLYLWIFRIQVRLTEHLIAKRRTRRA